MRACVGWSVRGGVGVCLLIGLTLLLTCGATTRTTTQGQHRQQRREGQTT